MSDSPDYRSDSPDLSAPPPSPCCTARLKLIYQLEHELAIAQQDAAAAGIFRTVYTKTLDSLTSLRSQVIELERERNRIQIDHDILLKKLRLAERDQ